MTTFVVLTAINLRLERDWLNARGFPGAREMGADEFDDLELPVTPPAPERAEPIAPPPGTYYPIVVSSNDIREFYARRNANTPGTRIVYRNGAARPVKESLETVIAAFGAQVARS